MNLRTELQVQIDRMLLQGERIERRKELGLDPIQEADASAVLSTLKKVAGQLQDVADSYDKLPTGVYMVTVWFGILEETYLVQASTEQEAEDTIREHQLEGRPYRVEVRELIYNVNGVSNLVVRKMQ